MTNWDEKAKLGAVQRGTGPGEFGPEPSETTPNYSDRKQYHMQRAPHRQQAWNEEQMRKLDEAGRHRSEWAYSAYDGRQDGEIPHGAGYQEMPRRSPYPSHVIEEYRAPIKRSRKTPLTKEEIEWRHEQLKKDHEGYEYASDRDGISTHKD